MGVYWIGLMFEEDMMGVCVVVVIVGSLVDCVNIGCGDLFEWIDG